MGMDDDRVLNELRSLGEHLQSQVSPERSRQVAIAALAAQRRRRSLRWVPATVGASIFLVGNVALAATSDRALPGELLYPADRAYEWLADLVVNSDRTPERVEEALILIERGETALALETVEDILGDQADLDQAVAALASNANSQDVRDKVKDLVAAAALVSDAAQSGDQAALHAAIDVVHQEAAEVAAEASNGQAGGNNGSDDKDNSDSPAVTAPGQVEPPSVTAPGQVDEPSTTTSQPGQGQGGGRGEGSGSGGENGQGQGGGQP